MMWNSPSSRDASPILCACTRHSSPTQPSDATYSSVKVTSHFSRTMVQCQLSGNIFKINHIEKGVKLTANCAQPNYQGEG